MNDGSRLLEFLLSAPSRKTVLLTLTGIVGTTSRALGTQMAVHADGSAFGSLSGGCVEAAIIGEALRVLQSGHAEIMRFGQGSRMIDIRLPCGGGMDVLITPAPQTHILQQAAALLRTRSSAALLLNMDGKLRLRPGTTADKPGWENGWFTAPLLPQLKLFIAGHGAETTALAKLAFNFGVDVTVLSPDETLATQLSQTSASIVHLKNRHSVPPFEADSHAAVILLFHDHDWEFTILTRSLAQEAFFIGAMGSRATHAARLKALAAQGIHASSLARITGPVGLIQASRDPETLALSALAQIIQTYHASIKQARDSRQFLPRSSPEALQIFHPVDISH